MINTAKETLDKVSFTLYKHYCIIDVEYVKELFNKKRKGKEEL
jgi:chemotaxis signal transduction protein